jgi:hypothetical protein
VPLNTARADLAFIMCHEAAHRLGIASEQEANFSAFLACQASEDVRLSYSGYFNAFAYCVNALLRADAGDRAEDLDELDELLEIALGKLSVGEAAVQKVVEDFVEDELQEKMRQKVPEPSEEALPYKIAGRQGKFCWWKVSFFLGLVLILIVLAVSVLKSGRSDVDDAGDLLLKKSRSLEVLDMLSDSVSPEQAESVVDSSLLRDLPTPELRE